jgi:uncharacterized cupredoxin-like copper-binding protein
MHHKRTLLTLAIGGLAVVSAACGDSDGDTSAADRPAKTVQVEMVDIAFKPETIEVTKGETVRFVFANNGKVQHEAYVGGTQEQVAHEEEMKEGGMNSGGHDAHGGGEADSSKVTVKPGDTGEIETAFGEAGTYEIGCHEPGHYEAGMKITVEVS